MEKISSNTKNSGLNVVVYFPKKYFKETAIEKYRFNKNDIVVLCKKHIYKMVFF